MKAIFCSLSIFLFCSLFQSCFTYTVGYDTIGNGYFEKYSQDSIYYYETMQRFGFEHNNLMLDSSYVNKYFKDIYFSISESKQVFNQKKLYPLYPLIRYSGLHTWYVKSPNQDLIFELGLFNCKFDNARDNSCGLFLYGVYEVTNFNKIISYLPHKKTRKERKTLDLMYSRRFEKEIIPLMKPYFEEYKKRKQ